MDELEVEAVAAEASAMGGSAAPEDHTGDLAQLETQFTELLEGIDNIFVAAGDGELEKVQAYVAGGVSVNSQDMYGYTPLCVLPIEFVAVCGAHLGSFPSLTGVSFSGSHAASWRIGTSF
jgi:hypothetical protein